MFCQHCERCPEFGVGSRFFFKKDLMSEQTNTKVLQLRRQIDHEYCVREV